MLLGAGFAGTAMAQSYSVQQPSSIRQMQFQQDDYSVADTQSGTTVSPSNTPPAPSAPAISAKADDKPAAEAPKEEPKAEEAKADDKPAEEGPYRLFHGPWLDCHHLDIRGHVDGGYTFNPDSPINRFNGPYGYNDRNGEIDINQVYLTAERLTKIENDCGEDYGYRADIMYGTDRRFVQTLPGTQWDSGWDNGNRFYGLAMPQLYGDLAINKLLLRGGHFYAPLGNEVEYADGNFFYSHSYAFLYAEPTTLTGGMGTYKVKDKLTVNAGIDTGWNEFTALNGKPNFFFGFNWTSKDDKFTLNEEILIGNTQPSGIDSTRTLLNTVATAKLGAKWHYAAELNFGHDNNNLGTGPASWWGWTNYMLYDINDCWGFGLRYEYMEDLDGAVVAQIGPPAFADPGSKWNELTLGLNYKPNKNVTLRTETRWDWAENGATNGNKPFVDNNANGQFTWGNDVIVRF